MRKAARTQQANTILLACSAVHPRCHCAAFSSSKRSLCNSFPARPPCFRPLPRKICRCFSMKNLGLSAAAAKSSPSGRFLPHVRRCCARCSSRRRDGEARGPRRKASGPLGRASSEIKRSIAFARTDPRAGELGLVPGGLAKSIQLHSFGGVRSSCGWTKGRKSLPGRLVRLRAPVHK